jgi:hypothetical protein
MSLRRRNSKATRLAGQHNQRQFGIWFRLHLAFDTSGTAHARDIVTDTGWKIVLNRGLDIFQPPVRNEGFNLSDRLQEHRMLKGFYVTYVRQLMAHG